MKAGDAGSIVGYVMGEKEGTPSKVVRPALVVQVRPAREASLGKPGKPPIGGNPAVAAVRPLPAMPERLELCVFASGDDRGLIAHTERMIDHFDPTALRRDDVVRADVDEDGAWPAHSWHPLD